MPILGLERVQLVDVLRIGRVELQHEDRLARRQLRPGREVEVGPGTQTPIRQIERLAGRIVDFDKLQIAFVDLRIDCQMPRRRSSGCTATRVITSGPTRGAPLSQPKVSRASGAQPATAVGHATQRFTADRRSEVHIVDKARRPFVWAPGNDQPDAVAIVLIQPEIELPLVVHDVLSRLQNVVPAGI